MKIDDLQKNVNSTLMKNVGESRVNQKTSEQNNPSIAGEQSIDSSAAVDFSRTSMAVSKVARAMENAPAERTEKINAIKDQIENGTYHVDAAHVADKIISDSLTNLAGA